jgi:hypothetical protein
MKAGPSEAGEADLELPLSSATNPLRWMLVWQELLLLLPLRLWDSHAGWAAESLSLPAPSRVRMAAVRVLPRLLRAAVLGCRLLPQLEGVTG